MRLSILVVGAAILTLLSDCGQSNIEISETDKAASELRAKAKMAEIRAQADDGDPKAQFSLGVEYYIGKRVAQNYERAVRYHRLAAKQGHINAQSVLGLMYGMGAGVARDYSRSYFWYSLAATQGAYGASKGRSLAAGQLTASQTAHAQKLAT